MLVPMYQEDFHLSHYRPFPPNCRRNTRKTDEVYDFLQSAKLTCVGDLWTQTLRSISQSPRATSVRHHSLTSFGKLLRVFPEFKGHTCTRRSTLRIGGNRRLCPFSVCCGDNSQVFATKAGKLAIPWRKYNGKMAERDRSRVIGVW